MGLVDEIKNQVKKSGSNKGKFLYFKPGNKIRIRFLQDLEDGIKILFHDSYSRGINAPCQEYFGKTCEYCEDEDLRSRDQFAWSVWDHEAKEVKILMAAVNSFTYVPALVAMYETYGTLLDRDYVITKNGTGQTSSYSVVPMDKAKFMNKKAKPYTKSKFLELVDKAFPTDDTSDDEDEQERPKKKLKNTEKADSSDYEEYTAKELYEECISRGLEVEKKKQKSTYIKLLEEDDAEYEDEEDDEDEEENYDSMTAKELYKLCKEKDIDVKPKKTKEYYIDLLEEYEEEDEEEEWENEEEEEDEWE